MSRRDEIRAAKREGRRAAFAEMGEWARRRMTDCLNAAHNRESLGPPDWHMNRFTVYELVSYEALSRYAKVKP